MNTEDERVLSCANCAVGNCAKLDKSFPAFCPTAGLGEGDAQSSLDRYLESPEDRRMSITAARVESDYYCAATRAEEVLLFAKRMEYKKVGVATCYGLLAECNVFAKAARAYGVNLYGVACKVGSIDKTAIGLDDAEKLTPGTHESMCNPILQAELLNREETDFNVIIGLCVGHDSLFIKHSKAPVTYLIVKDRVLCHNPVAALYTANSYYNRLFKPESLVPRKIRKTRKK
ncbi:MAG: DUF1847 domain-containing protein [Synergistaceae bacterium]|jgi:uncharacterized metal-binding protein|nr:DUF1847 domain-containing protein [Synergistaceae bacterium]